MTQLEPMAAAERRAELSVECQDVHQHFRSGATTLTALGGVDLSVRRGEFVALLGPSGCGKSTLLRMLDGLDRPSSGRLLIDGRPVTGPRTDVGMVFQNDALVPWRTVLANVLLAGELGDSRDPGVTERAERLLATVGLKQFAHHYPHQMSGGMRQRANLARALSINPVLLLMDEPFGALDAQTRELMQNELLRLWESERKTVVFVTHSIEEAVYLADRVVLLSARPGRVAAEYVIDLPRPRDPEIRHAPEFGALCRDVWGRLRVEVNRTFHAAEENGPPPAKRWWRR